MVIVVGPGSPRDYPELRESPTQQENPFSGSPGDNKAGDDTRVPPADIFTSHTFKNNAPAYRWCSKCNVWKPDRCHHCSTCRRCFLRMDHHCPWFACCIGFRNQKLFVQLLVYIAVYCMVVFCVLGAMMWKFFEDEAYDGKAYLLLNLVLCTVVSLAFSVAMAFFAGFTVWMTLHNYTTIEFQDRQWNYSESGARYYEFDSSGKKVAVGHIWDISPGYNWKSVMGPNWVSWMLPTLNGGNVLGNNDGVNFTVNTEVYEKYKYNAQLQDQLNAQLAEYRDRVRGVRREDPSRSDDAQGSGFELSSEE